MIRLGGSGALGPPSPPAAPRPAPGRSRRAGRRLSVLPGRAGTLGFTLFYLSALVLLPLGVMAVRAAGVGPGGLISVLTSWRVLAAFRTSFGIALIAALLDVAIGLLLAWVLVRYRFPGRRIMDAMIDLPIAFPTAVAGIALTALYSQGGWFGAPLEAMGIHVASTPLGIGIALVFVGLPFVVRAVEPVLADLDRDVEDAAATLGAGRGQVFRRVILPAVTPALLTGFALAFGRAVGEYGSVIFIAGNRPGVSEIVPLLIVIKLDEEYDYGGAAVLGTLMLAASFLIILAVNTLERWSRRHAR